MRNQHYPLPQVGPDSGTLACYFLCSTLTCSTVDSFERA
jgi:hypothetical protein